MNSKLIYKSLAVSLLIVSLVVLSVANAHDTGWRPQHTIEHRYAITSQHFGVTFIGEHDGFGVHVAFWYCVLDRCYKLPPFITKD